MVGLRCPVFLLPLLTAMPHEPLFGHICCPNAFLVADKTDVSWYHFCLICIKKLPNAGALSVLCHAFNICFFVLCDHIHECEASTADIWGRAEARGGTSFEADDRIMQSQLSQVSQVSMETFHWCNALLITSSIYYMTITKQCVCLSVCLSLLYVFVWRMANAAVQCCCVIHPSVLLYGGWLTQQFSAAVLFTQCDVVWRMANAAVQCRCVIHSVCCCMEDG